MSERPNGGPSDGAARAESRASLPALETENAQLRAALDSRVVIEQAKGILAERFALGLPEAFLLLRSAARANQLKLHAVALAVVASPETPREVIAARDVDGRQDG